MYPPPPVPRKQTNKPPAPQLDRIFILANPFLNVSKACKLYHAGVWPLVVVLTREQAPRRRSHRTDAAARPRRGAARRGAGGV